MRAARGYLRTKELQDKGSGVFIYHLGFVL